MNSHIGSPDKLHYEVSEKQKGGEKPLSIFIL